MRAAHAKDELLLPQPTRCRLPDAVGAFLRARRGAPSAKSAAQFKRLSDLARHAGKHAVLAWGALGSHGSLCGLLKSKYSKRAK